MWLYWLYLQILQLSYGCIRQQSADIAMGVDKALEAKDGEIDDQKVVPAIRV